MHTRRWHTIGRVQRARQSSVPWWFWGGFAAYGLVNCIDIAAGGQRGEWIAWPIRLVICALMFVLGLYLALLGRRARRALPDSSG